jgi:hypothetical protein
MAWRLVKHRDNFLPFSFIYEIQDICNFFGGVFCNVKQQHGSCTNCFSFRLVGETNEPLELGL